MNGEGRRGEPGEPGQGRTGGAGGAGGAGGEGGEEGGVGGVGGAGGAIDLDGQPVRIIEPGPLGRYVRTQVFLLVVLAVELGLLLVRVE